MACDLRCPNCEDNLGKDTENSALASCGNCGERNIFNERGDTDDLNEEELSLFKSKLRKKRGY
jgi:DNA-directed RNA polymerase subunit RPC12/RpoP